jgi:hypothetical protein
MTYSIKTRTIIESATLELTGEQLQELANAQPALHALCMQAGLSPPPELQPVRQLLSSITDAIHGATIAPAPATPGKKPLSEKQRASMLANAAKARAAKAAQNPTPGA